MDEKELNEKINEFCKLSYEAKRLDTIAKELKKQIVNVMEDADKSHISTGEYTVSLSSVISDISFNEDAFCEYAREHNELKKTIKLKEYVDFDVLESLIYDNKLTTDELRKIKDFETVTSYTKINKGKVKK